MWRCRARAVIRSTGRIHTTFLVRVAVLGVGLVPNHSVARVSVRLLPLDPDPNGERGKEKASPAVYEA